MIHLPGHFGRGEEKYFGCENVQIARTDYSKGGKRVGKELKLDERRRK